MKIFRGFKLIFSRLFAVAITVIAQVVIIAHFMIKLTTSYIYFQLAESIIGFLVFVALVNRRMNPEQKIIWAFLIIIFPVIGVTLYILFSSNTPSIKRIKKYTKFDKKIIEQTNQYNESIYQTAKEYKGQIKYLENMSSMYPRKNTTTNYYKDGRQFYVALMNDLKNAKKHIFMEYFIIRPGKMWDSIVDVLKQKAQEGVDVRFIYDDLGSAKYVKGNYYKKLRKYGIKCYKFNKMIPLVSS